jgi:hypothetical protein
VSKQLTTTPFKTFASAYLQQGWFIFPLRPNGKEPITQNGFKDASNDLEVIENWIRRYPSSNIGIATEASNLIVIDCDSSKGEATKIKRTRENGKLIRISKKSGEVIK